MTWLPIDNHHQYILPVLILHVFGGTRPIQFLHNTLCRQTMNDRGDDEEIDVGNLDNDDNYDDDIDPREDIYDLGESEEDSEDDDESTEEEIDNETVETFIFTFHRGDYDAEFDDALKYDRSVIPRLSPTQASYIKSENWIERNRIGLERVKEQLQIASTRCRMNKVSI